MAHMGVAQKLKVTFGDQSAGGYTKAVLPLGKANVWDFLLISCSYGSW